MDEIILAANGVLRTGNGEPVSDALGALDMRVSPGEGCTLRSFMRMLAEYPDLTRLNAFAPDFAARHGHGADDGAVPDGLARLELSAVVEMIGHPEPPRLEIYHIFRGVGTDGADVEIKPWRVESLLDLPIALGPLRHVVFGDRVEGMDFATVCSLFDFIEGICWQLAFHGAPQECALRR